MSTKESVCDSLMTAAILATAGRGPQLKQSEDRFLHALFVQVRTFMTEFDSDCDGKMSFAEFQKAVEALKDLEEGEWSF